jgi:hypothetical protein
MAARIDRDEMAALLRAQNPNRSLRYLYEQVIGE